MSYDVYMDLLVEEVGETLEVEAMEEAMADIEEEYDSEVVSDYMIDGV